MNKNVKLCDICHDRGNDTLAVERVTVAYLTSGKVTKDLCEQDLGRFNSALPDEFVPSGTKPVRRAVKAVGNNNGARARKGTIVPGTLTARVYEAMTKKPGTVWGGNDLMEKLSDVDDVKKVRSALGNLEKAGHLERVERGKYRATGHALIGA